MGKIASKYCYKIYLTDDNPRYENPSEIRREIKKGFFKNNFKEIPSRKTISTAINDLKASDILIVAGKGHENYQEYKKKSSFSDKRYYFKKYKKKKFSFVK